MSEELKILKDIITIIAACSAIFIGFSGLSSWKKQLKGTAEYNLSKRLITGLYSYRDAIKHVRNPALYNHEREMPSQEQVKTMSKDEIDFYGYSKAYQNRWNKVDEAKKQFYADRLEGEAIWGKEFIDLFKPIPELENELFSALQTNMIVRNPESSKADKDAWREMSRKKRDVLYDVSNTKKSDEFMSELNDAIGKFEGYLKPHLKNS